MKKTTLILLVAVILATTTAFECGKTPAANEGFYLHTRIGIFQAGFPVQVIQPDVTVFGAWEADLPLATGTKYNFKGTTDSAGFLAVPEARAPARWQFGEFTGPCTNQSFVDVVNLGQDYVVLCDTTCFWIKTNCPPSPLFAAEPSYIDPTEPPGTVIITGSGIDATYGMPYVSFFDLNGYVLAEGRASDVSGNGTSLSAVVPDISSVPSGFYWAIVRNVAADGSLQFLGAAGVYVGGIYEPPPPDPEPSPCGDGPCLIY